MYRYYIDGRMDLLDEHIEEERKALPEARSVRVWMREEGFGLIKSLCERS